MLAVESGTGGCDVLGLVCVCVCVFVCVIERVLDNVSEHWVMLMVAVCF